MATNSNRKRIGALWKRKSNDGKKSFMTGTVEVNGAKIDVVVFPALEKPTVKHPDAVIYLSEPREAGKAAPAKPAGKPAAAKPAAAPAAAPAGDGELL